MTIVKGSTAFGEILYDVAMSLHAKAIYHSKCASEIIRSDMTATTAASQHFKNAAAIMRYLHDSLLPRWVSARGRQNLPPETSEAVCQSLYHYFTACVQILAIVKTLQREGGAPPTFMTKLCIPVATELDKAIDVMIRQTGDFLPRLNANTLLTHFGILR